MLQDGSLISDKKVKRIPFQVYGFLITFTVPVSMTIKYDNKI